MLLCIIVGMAVFADLIVPYAKCVEQVGADRLQWPSVAHWFGTDEFGRDVFARVVHGARYSLFIGVATSLMALESSTFSCAYRQSCFPWLLWQPSEPA